MRSQWERLRFDLEIRLNPVRLREFCDKLPFVLVFRSRSGKGCRICQGVYLTEKGVQRSARLTGCIHCTILQGVVRTARASQGCSCRYDTQLEFHNRAINWSCDKCEAHLDVELFTVKGIFCCGTFTVSNRCANNCPPELAYMGINSIPERRYAVGSTATDAAITVISQWLDTCEKHHPKCHVATNPPLPPGVIEINASRGQIPTGDAEDWGEQCPRMANIYHNAYLTLAASAAHEPRAGLYTSAEGEWARGQEIFTMKSGDHVFGVFARAPMLAMDSSLTHEPLFQRAWAYQERILSRRVLHFTHREILWECNEQIACQCSHLGTSTSIKNTWSQSTDLSGLQRSWHDLVEEYSHRKLPYATDRLPALAGIAKQMSVLRTDDVYLAGLWRNTLITDLIWQASNATGKLNPKPCTWQAPSWSWASVNTGVMFELKRRPARASDEFCPTLSYVSHSCTALHATDGGCFGGVESASLTVHGSLLSVTGSDICITTALYTRTMISRKSSPVTPLMRYLFISSMSGTDRRHRRYKRIFRNASVMTVTLV
ncbi:hypothetical protein BDV25DRAFT_135108 [Aspergillus avenaceus]|uniref:Heterokaryon incompatibility domain-containing protein n=1 Tax=Aspergillus avenaceus TaxID=36643 RepID=A0A5N6UA60_ASPAV|nr:hypothetical protein BDV25DRAFT_135108 [Aspergillus avenaceus]